MSNPGEGKEENKIYKIKRYFSLALDPIYVGTGGYRIGRVDNTIVREPSTGIPKIPGTTIEGCCRNYAYLRLKENGKNISLACAKGKPKGERKEEQPCGICPLCITFGYTRDSEREIEIEENGTKTKKKIAKSMQAMALFSDARILFFPVATMIGPIWITCPMVLREAGIKNVPKPEKDKFIAASELKDFLPNKGDDTDTKILNFGWLLLEGKCEDITLPISRISEEILKRIVIVPDDLFITIVNSNLEVRTSVAIDPERGAAEERALFTYEAIPRGTVFWFDVIYQNPENFQISSWNTELIIKTVEDGFSLFEYLGIGGMGSRGFGRLKVLNQGGKNGGE